MSDLLVKEPGDFNPRLYNNVGAVTGCTGVQSGGKRSRRKQSRRKQSRRKRSRRKQSRRKQSRRKQSRRKRRMKGGRNGYGFSFQASPIGNVGHAQNLMDWETYDGKTISSDTNLGTYSITGGKRKRKQSRRKKSKRKRKQSRRKQSRRKQSRRKRCGCKRKQSRRKQRGGFTLGSNGSYYGYAGTQGEDLGLFSGSGYPPISSGSTNECINSPHTDGGASPITSSVSS